MPNDEFLIEQFKQGFIRTVPKMKFPQWLLLERTISSASVFQLTVVQGDIVNIAADAIVHPTNATYQFAGEVGK